MAQLLNLKELEIKNPTISGSAFKKDPEDKSKILLDKDGQPVVDTDKALNVVMHYSRITLGDHVDIVGGDGTQYRLPKGTSIAINVLAPFSGFSPEGQKEIWGNTVNKITGKADKGDRAKADQAALAAARAHTVDGRSPEERKTPVKRAVL